MANFALVILIFLSASAHASTVFDMSEHSGFIRDSSGNYSKVSTNGSVRSLTSNTALALVEKPFIQTSKGLIQVSLSRAAAVDVSRIGATVGGYAKSLGPVGLTVAAATLMCDLTNICNDAGAWVLRTLNIGGTSVGNYPSCQEAIGLAAGANWTDCTNIKNNYPSAIFFRSPSTPAVSLGCTNRGGTSWTYTAFAYTCTNLTYTTAPATDANIDSKSTSLNDARFTPELHAKDQNIPITTPTLTGSPVSSPVATTTKTLKDGSGTVTGSETTTTSLDVTDGATNATPNIINITEKNVTNIYNNMNVLQSSTTNVSDIPQPKADPVPDTSIKFDTVNDTPLTEKVVAAPFTTTSWGSGACPPDIVMNLTRGNYSIDSQPFCDFSIALKPVLLLIATLAGAYIVITSTRPTAS